MFLETPRLPDTIALGAEGGPEWNTEITRLVSGQEQRNQVWDQALQQYTISLVNRTEAEFAIFLAFMRNVHGRLDGFRFKDFTEFSCSVAAGRLGTSSLGTGAPSYQLYKRYTTGALTNDRIIRKPVSGTISVTRNGGGVTVGAGAGQIAIDTTTGTITFVADQTRSISSHTPGASHVFTLASAFSPNLVIGGKIFVAGITGTAASVLNNIAHTITNIASNVITVSTTTTGLTASSGTASFFPQPTESLAAAFEFDVPVRFDTDKLRARAGTKFAGGSLAITWDSVVLQEIRT